MMIYLDSQTIWPKMKPKYYLVFFVIFACFFDLGTALWHRNFMSLEANPIFIKAGYIVFVIKIVITLVMVLLFLYTLKKNSFFNSFAIIYLMVLFTVYQLFGGIMNIQAKNYVLEDMQDRFGEDTYPTLDSIPTEIVEQNYSMSAPQKLRAYTDFAFMSMILPIIITLASFKFWEKCYLLNNGEV